MSNFLKSTPVTDEQRRAHDRHRPGPVLGVMLVLVTYFWLFTAGAGWVRLPVPEVVLQHVGIEVDHVFDDAGTVDSNLVFSFAEQFDTDAQDLFVFFVVLAAAFACCYYAPLRYKQASLALGSTIALGLIYGVRETAGLLFAHLVAYLVFHPTRRPWIPLLAGLPAALAFTPPGSSANSLLLAAAGAALGIAAAYRFALEPLLRLPRVSAVLRVLVAQSALITIAVFALFEWTSGRSFDLQLGILLFFWQWCRLILYGIDFHDGLVPRDTPIHRYLAVFLSPGALPAWDWGVELGLGYSYCNNSFLCEDKNRTVMSGVRMLWLALGYLVLGDPFRHLLGSAIETAGVELYGMYIVNMVAAYQGGEDVTLVSVLMTALMDTLRWTLWFVGVVHFKTGVWRICGYRFEPYFNRPWLATNLVNFWARYTYYYREFLLRAFYYPVFLRYFKQYPRVRMVVGTLAAAGAGNMIWGHLTERMYNHGMTTEALGYTLRTWPYYLLLSAGIALTALYLLKYSRRRRRRAWSPGPRMMLDVAASFGTMLYFSWIHILSRPAAGSSMWDLGRLFLRGLGI